MSRHALKEKTTVFKIPEHVRNKYEFVTLAAQRAEQLQTGAPARTLVVTNKVTVIAQAEVAEGLIDLQDLSEEPELVSGVIVEEE